MLSPETARIGKSPSAPFIRLRIVGGKTLSLGDHPPDMTLTQVYDLIISRIQDTHG